ncbi:hypothetical protein QCA50_003493 [Cerrena zonata]|uniref:PWWP domain-containing protein n=1 Tax=Cerrena zonata TaxID=2478898 RepID=A0AAW0GSB3_9APHY
MTSAEKSYSGKALPRRAAAKKASRLAAEQLESSPPPGDEFEEGASGATKLPRQRTPKAKPIRRKKSSVTAQSKDCTPKLDSRRTSPHGTAFTLNVSESGSDLENLGTLNTPLGRPLNISKRRRSTTPEVDIAASTGGLLGDLSPMSSPEQSFQSVLRNANQSPSRSLTSSSRRGTRMKRDTSHISISSDDDDLVVCDHAYNVGALVWVRLDRVGNICKDETNTMWWPAKVFHSLPLRVELFGSPPSSQEGDPVIADIGRPADNIILSFTTPSNSIRFHSGNYSTISNTAVTLFSPRKRQKVSDETVHAKWEAAFRAILEVDRVVNNDGFPRMVSYYLAQGSYDTSDEEQSLLDSPIAVDSDEDWTPPPPNPMYEIPGELILAKESATKTQFWPAKILDYVPPTDRLQKPKYRVLFFDGTIKNLRATLFYTEVDDGFKDCVLGEDKDNYELDEVEVDDPPQSQEYTDGAPLDIRSSSPVPELPPPEDFAFTPIPEQFRYVKPILTAILQEKYSPVKRRHKLFMGSAATRKKVCDTGHEKGELRAAEVEQLSTCIRRWIRRRRQRQELGLIPPDESQGLIDEDLPEEVLNTRYSPAESSSLVASGNNTDTDMISEIDLPPASVLSVSPDRDDALSAENAAQDGNPDQAIAVVQEDFVPGPQKSFTSLSEIEQLTYCTNILLPEAILQLLLWRAEIRNVLDLQSPEEEERLHCLAETKAQERYWVHDIVLYKRGLSRTMIGSSKPSSSQPKSKLRSGRF